MSNNPIFYSDRLFEVWSYTVSHRQLLLRSNKGNSALTRLEVLFKDVAFIAVPPVMKGVRIIKCDITDERSFLNLPVLPKSKPWYRIEADGAVGYVAAGTIVTNEDELGYEEPSPLFAAPHFGQ